MFIILNTEIYSDVRAIERPNRISGEKSNAHERQRNDETATTAPHETLNERRRTNRATGAGTGVHGSRVGKQPAMEGRGATVHRRGRAASAGIDSHRALSGAPRRGATVGTAAERVLRQRLGRGYGQPGGAAGAGRAEGDLCEWMAGGGGCKQCGTDVSRSKLVSGG